MQNQFRALLHCLPGLVAICLCGWLGASTANAQLRIRNPFVKKRTDPIQADSTPQHSHLRAESATQAEPQLQLLRDLVRSSESPSEPQTGSGGKSIRNPFAAPSATVAERPNLFGEVTPASYPSTSYKDLDEPSSPPPPPANLASSAEQPWWVDTAPGSHEPPPVANMSWPTNESSRASSLDEQLPGPTDAADRQPTALPLPPEPFGLDPQHEANMLESEAKVINERLEHELLEGQAIVSDDLPAYSSLPNPAIDASLASAGLDPIPTSATAQTQAQFLPLLYLDIQGPQQIKPAHPANFYVFVANRGAAAANEVALHLPAVEAYEVGQVEIDGQIFATQFTTSRFPSQQVPLGKIAPGEDRRIKLVLHPRRAGQLSLDVELSMKASVAREWRVQQPAVNLELTAPQAIRFDQPFTVLATVTNSDSASIDQANLTLIESESMKVLSRNNVPLKPLPAGSKQEIAFEVMVEADEADPALDHEFTLEVFGSGIHKKTRHTVSIQPAALDIQLVTVNEELRQGQAATYAIQVQNLSADTLPEVNVAIDFPSTIAVRVLDRVAAVNENDNSFLYRLTNLPAGETELIRLSAVALQAGVHTPTAFASLPDTPQSLVSCELPLTFSRGMPAEQATLDNPRLANSPIANSPIAEANTTPPRTAQVWKLSDQPAGHDSAHKR